MALPSEMVKVSMVLLGRVSAGLFWRQTIERRMNSIVIEIIPERFELSFQVKRITKEHLVKKLAMKN
jgi:hypothetical protein